MIVRYLTLSNAALQQIDGANMRQVWHGVCTSKTNSALVYACVIGKDLADRIRRKECPGGCVRVIRIVDHPVTGIKVAEVAPETFT